MIHLTTELVFAFKSFQVMLELSHKTNWLQIYAQMSAAVRVAHCYVDDEKTATVEIDVRHSEFINLEY